MESDPFQLLDDAASALVASRQALRHKVTELVSENDHLKQRVNALEKDNTELKEALEEASRMDGKAAVEGDAANGPKIRLQDGTWMDIIELEKKYRATEYARKALEAKRKEDRNSIRNWEKEMGRIEKERDALSFRVTELESQLSLYVKDKDAKKNNSKENRPESAFREPLRDVTANYINTRGQPSVITHSAIANAVPSSQASTVGETSPPSNHGESPSASRAIKRESQGIPSSPSRYAAESIDLAALGMTLSSPPRQPPTRMSMVMEEEESKHHEEDVVSSPQDVSADPLADSSSSNSGGQRVQRVPATERKRRRGDFIDEIDEDLRTGRREVMFDTTTERLATEERVHVHTPGAALPRSVATPLDMWLGHKKQIFSANTTEQQQLPTPTSVDNAGRTSGYPNETPTRARDASKTDRITVKKEHITIADLKALEWHPRDFVVNPNANGGTKHAYQETVRGKARQCEHGASCKECSTFYKVAGLDERLGMPELVSSGSRHRNRWQRPPSPPGFWRSEFPNTQEQEADKRTAQVQQAELAKIRLAEALKPNGAYMFRKKEYREAVRAQLHNP